MQEKMSQTDPSWKLKPKELAVLDEAENSNIDQELFDANWSLHYPSYHNFTEWLEEGFDVHDPKTRRYQHLLEGFHAIYSLNYFTGESQLLQLKPVNPLYVYDRPLRNGEKKEEGLADSFQYLKMSGTKMIKAAKRHGIIDNFPSDQAGNLLEEGVSTLTEKQKADLARNSGLTDYVKFKPIKYEYVKQKPDNKGKILEVPFIFPLLTEKIFKKLCKENEIPYPGKIETYLEQWQYLAKHTKTIWITEGHKKAMALLSQGNVAIASLSATTHSQRKKEGVKNTQLKKDLKKFLGKRDNFDIVIAFDSNDKKASTRQAIKKQVINFGKKLTKYGTVSIAKWTDSTCKGIDDYLVKYKNLSEVNLIPLKQYKSKHTAWYNRELTPDQIIHSRYVNPDIFVEPRRQGKKMIAIKSAQNTGKTSAIKKFRENYKEYKKGTDPTGARCHIPSRGNLGFGTIEYCDFELKQYCIAFSNVAYKNQIAIKDPKKAEEIEDFTFLNFDWNEVEILETKGRFPEQLHTFVPLHRRTLATNIARKLQLQDYQNEYPEEYETSGEARCVDSILQCGYIKHYNDMVIDEASQVLWHTLSSYTEMKKNRLAKIAKLKEIGKTVTEDNNGVIVLMDADLDDKTIAGYASIFNIKKDEIWTIENTYKPFSNRDMLMYDDIADLRSEINHSIANGERIMIMTSGQRSSSTHGSINLENHIKELIKENPTFGLKESEIIRLDSMSLSDKDHEAYEMLSRLEDLRQYKVIIASSSLNTGVDLTKELIGEVDNVFGIFYGNYPLNDFEQAMERYRGDATRHIYCVMTSNCKIQCGSASFDTLMETILGHTKHIVDKYNIDEKLLSYELVAHYCQFATSINNDYKNLYDNFIARAEAKGYNIKQGERISGEERKSLKADFKATRENEESRFNQDVIKAPDINDLEHQILDNKLRKTYQETVTLKKANMKRKYLTEDVTTDLLELDKDYQYVLNRYYSRVDPKVIESRDQLYLDYLERTAQQLYPVDITKSIKHPVVKVLQQLDMNKMLNTINDSEFLFTNSTAGKFIRDIRQLTDFVTDIRHVLKLDLNSTAPEMRIMSSLLNRFGYTLVSKGSKRIKGKCVRVYKIESIFNQKLYDDIEARWLERDRKFLETLNDTHPDADISYI